jgi:hypothetical protein
MRRKAIVNGQDDTRPLSVGEWMLTLFILAIPVVNLIMYILWALGGNVNRRNYCRAVIYWALILTVLVIVLSLATGQL